MPIAKGANIIVDHLIAERVPYLFGLCGHGIIGLMDALNDRRDRIGTISVHNEQIAGFAADAFFRVSRQPVGTFTSCGPGSVNIQMAVANALFDGTPMLVITGNIPTQQFNKGPFQEFGHHHQADYVTAMRPYTKRSFQATRADQLPQMVRQAWNTMLAGPMGPVNLDVPFNVFTESAEAEANPDAMWHRTLAVRPALPAELVDLILDLLLQAERPLILAGHGCLLAEASTELLEFSRALRIPVATTPQGKGILDADYELHLGPTGRDGVYPANRASRGCDLLLAVGTRFGDRSTSSWHDGVTHQIPPTRLIHIDLDPAILGRNYNAAVGAVADAKQALRQLIAAVKSRADLSPQRRMAWIDATSQWKKRWDADTAVPKTSIETPLHPARVVSDLTRAVPTDAVVLSDIGAHHSWMVQQWPQKTSGRFLQSGGGATMGFGVGGAIGAQFAAPDRAVVAVVGDGGMLMHASAIATAVEYELPIVWVVWNNCGFVSIRDLQRAFFGKDREFATRFRNRQKGELTSVDFAMMARSMGAQGFKAERPGDVADQVSEALHSRKPTVIDALVASDALRFTAGTWDLPPIDGLPPNYDPFPLGGVDA